MDWKPYITTDPQIMHGRIRIIILNRIFHQTALYPPDGDGRTVNRVTIHASPAVFPKMLPFAESNFPRSAPWHARTPSLPVGSGYNQTGFANQAA